MGKKSPKKRGCTYAQIDDFYTQEEEVTEDERVGWRHGLNGHESEHAPGIGDGQGGLACCSPWGRKDSDTTE